MNKVTGVAMKRRTRINYTPEQKAIIWDRYKQGDSLHDIARMFDRYHSSIMPTMVDIVPLSESGIRWLFHLMKERKYPERC